MVAGKSDRRDRRDGGRPRRGRPESRRGDSSKRYSVATKLALLAEYERSGLTQRDFCVQHGVSTATLCKWRRAYEQRGERGLEPKKPKKRKIKARGAYRPEERRQAVEAFLQSDLTQRDFARTWGVSTRTLSLWIGRYEQDGPESLDHPRSGRKRKASTPGPVQDAIAQLKRRFPYYGLRRIRDSLRRFAGLKASVPQIRQALREADLTTPPEPVRRKRNRPAPRRFERSKPRELWQSDITSYWLSRQQRRVYLTVFLDDYSRYVVSWALHTHQRSEMVCEALLDGIARYGRPNEVLTDQGRQYFTWRGKGRFQKLLQKEGIRHVVSRAHHPETLGKTERLWSTVGSELWDRVMPEDLVEARSRLRHFFSYYNFFRTHRGIDGLVPADRFFGAEDAVRKTIESRLKRNELALALGEPPRAPVFLSGRVGGQEVSLHGEQGALVIHTPEGGRQELRIEELGGTGDGKGETKAAGTGQAKEPGGAEDAGTGEGSVGQRERGGAAARTRDECRDPAVLAGEDDEAGGGGDAGGKAVAGLAAESTGAVGYGGGTAEAAAQKEVRDGALASRGGPEGAEEADRGAGTGAGDRAGRDPVAAGSAREPRQDAARGEGGREKKADEEEGSPEASGRRSERGSGRDGSDGVSAPRSPDCLE
jgi:transposase InsO family protein/DNA-binding transcriptional regulator YiaG